MKIRQFPPPHYTDFDIFNPKIQEQGNKDYLLWLKQNPSLKRPLQDPMVITNKKTKGSDVVTLDDSDSDTGAETDGTNSKNLDKICHDVPKLKLAALEGLVIKKVTENGSHNDATDEKLLETDTSYVNQSEETNSAEVNNESVDSDIIEIDLSNENNEQQSENTGNANGQLTIASVESQPMVKIENDIITDDVSDSDDDDIQVLEQKLAASKIERGRGRLYVETDKSSVTSKNKVVNVAKRSSVYIPSQREEYFKQTLVNDIHVDTVTLDDSGSDNDSDDQVTIINNDHGSLTKIQNESMNVLAPDIVNLEDSDNDSSVECSIIDGGNNSKATESVITTTKYKSLAVKVMSQREEFLLSQNKSGKINNIAESFPLPQQTESLAANTKKTEFVRSQREEFLLAQRERGSRRCYIASVHKKMLSKEGRKRKRIERHEILEEAKIQRLEGSLEPSDNTS